MDAMTNYPQQRKLDMRAELEARDGHLVVPDEPLSECRVSGWGGDGKSLQTAFRRRPQAGSDDDHGDSKPVDGAHNGVDGGW